MEILSVIFLYSMLTGVFISIFFGIYAFIVNLFIIFTLTYTYSISYDCGILNSILLIFLILAANQISFLCGLAYVYFRKKNIFMRNYSREKAHIS